MKLCLRVFMALAAVLMIGTAAQAARPSKPMDLFFDNPIETASGKQLSPAEIERTIVRAAPHVAGRSRAMPTAP